MRFIVFQLVLMIFYRWSTITCPFNLYESSSLIDENVVQFDCLYYYTETRVVVDQELSNVIDELIPYCFSSITKRQISLSSSNQMNGVIMSFVDLSLANITSQQLLSWSISINIAERYEFYLNERNDALNEQIYNCTNRWFGDRCQYSLESNETMSLIEVVQNQFHGRLSYPKTSVLVRQLSCYIHVRCNRGGISLCLDWREVCDGHVDCLDGGEDEIQCNEMESNECLEDEFRCQNGECIPEIFWNNDINDADCLDRSDELSSIYIDSCFQDPSFRCEEHTCKQNGYQFTCGDGQCVNKFDYCENGRHRSLEESMFRKGNLSEKCRNAILCFIQVNPGIDDSLLCEPVLESNCPPIFQFPVIPIHFGHIRFLYTNSQLNHNSSSHFKPDYVCYDEQLCDFLVSNFSYGDQRCVQSDLLKPFIAHTGDRWVDLVLWIDDIFRPCSIQHQMNEENKTSSSLYFCQNSSKSISKYRILDQNVDCYLKDDENASLSCSVHIKHRVECSDGKHCLSPLLSGADCPTPENSDHINIPFDQICDGMPMIADVNEETYTDESNCDRWPCNNMYSRCDNIRTCSDGQDEINCHQTGCLSEEYACISPINYTLICLSFEHVDNNITDCLGASDEVKYCLAGYPSDDDPMRFRCSNSDICLPFSKLCDGTTNCFPSNDDEIFCIEHRFTCHDKSIHNSSVVEQLFCRLNGENSRRYFSVHTSSNYPFSENNLPNKRNYWSRQLSVVINDIPSPSNSYPWPWVCNRGLVVLFNNSNIENRCFCPSSSYGDFCEYQNQRVSVTLQLNAINKRTSYAFVLLLIDDDDENEEIESSDQFMYIGQHSCLFKINRYLLYSKRPKIISKNYSVIIHVFDKSQMIYVQSWHFNIHFPFLPVNRLVKSILISDSSMTISSDCLRHCQYGKCVKYSNKNKSFCRCYSGWSGIDCHIPLNCQSCSNDSICLGTTNNRTICVCPINKSGPRCLLRSLCPSNACLNGGECISADISVEGSRYHCICSEEYFGVRCEERRSKVDVSLEDIHIPSYVIAHFISISNESKPRSAVVLQKLTLFQRLITFRISISYNLLVIQANNKFYLAVIQQIPPNQLSTSINSKRECLSIEVLFNSSILSMTRFRRVKLYHIPCEENVNLQCFIDEGYLCLCTNEHHANCMDFDYRHKTLQCQGRDRCENGGQCLEDDPLCPSVTICVCQSCFFGNRCQFYTKGFGLTLDEILGYEIERNNKMSWQPFSVQFSGIVTMIIFIFGFINGILSLMTFTNKTIQDVGCGYYLLASSVVSLIIIILFTFKFWILFSSHFDFSIRRQLRILSGFGIEIPLKISLYMSNWLHACVAIERISTVYRGFNFNKKRSKYLAKKVIFCLPFIITALMIPQFVHMFVFDDEKEDRSWCVMYYFSWLQTYNLTMISFHFVGPLIINFLSSILIIMITARQRAAAHRDKHYLKHVQIKLNQYKHLLISPFLLIIFSSLHVSITLSLDCNNSPRRFWFHLIGYFLSFIPSISLFLIFVFPSRTYRKGFQLVVIHLWQ